MVKEEKEQKRSRTMLTVPYSNFADTAAFLGVTNNELCKELGYTNSAWPHWETKNQIPKVVGIACEGLKRRHARNMKPDAMAYVFSEVPKKHWATVKQLFDALGIRNTTVQL